MIPSNEIVPWKKIAPWQSPALVEQDLILSRALVELYNHPTIADKLVFRGGTALHKLFIPKPCRYSEDLDFVQIKAEPIGEAATAVREALSWLGKPRYKKSPGRLTFIYRFETSTLPVEKMRLKIEINILEHFSVLDLIHKDFEVNNPWFSGKTKVCVYQLDELLGTKLRALYQRKKGRDLFDLYIAKKHLNFNVNRLLECFHKYTQFVGTSISRAEFEENLQLKLQDSRFTQDMKPILASDLDWNFQEAYDYVYNEIVPHLPGEPWKGIQ